MATNPAKIGEFQKFYYQSGDFDLTQPDATVLGDANWKELCIVNLDVTSAFNETTFNDTCSADIEAVAPGRRQITVSFELNSLRISNEDITDWYAIADSRLIIAVLAMTGDKADDDEYGFIGNFHATQADEARPNEGPITQSQSLRPAADSAFTPLFRRIYGAQVPPGP